MYRLLLISGISLVAGLTLAAGQETPILGFGEHSRGGTGGRVLLVTRKDDDPKHPMPGSLRWALKEKGPRTVKFVVSGDIKLKDRIIIREPFLTVDGMDAPGDGICIRGGSLMFRDTHDIIVRQVRIRLGEEAAAQQRREQHAKRPQHSAGLDCVSLDDSHDIAFDHCSLSWSCDEIFGVTHCQNVTVQWCILSEPLADPKLHPYGDRHAFPINASASTLSVHHCLFAHFVMRGPQFEANDLLPKDDYTVKMEAVNNVMFDYERSGSRYGAGTEKNNGTWEGKSFRFQFINNLYSGGTKKSTAIEAIARHGVVPGVKVWASGNLQTVLRQGAREASPPLSQFAPGKGPVWNHQPERVVSVSGMTRVDGPFWTRKEDSAAIRRQVSGSKLFVTTASARPEATALVEQSVLSGAGCTIHRDVVDRKAIADVRACRSGKITHAKPGWLAWLGF